jgi:RNA polymerase sigma factor (sigma-70 family)
VTEAELVSLYKEYGYSVHRRCRTVLGEAAEAQDALHEVFLRAQASLPSNVPSKLAWLYEVANHYCYDVLRRRARRAALSQNWEARESVEPSPGPVFALTEIAGQVDEMSFRIGALHLIDGFTQEEIADRMRCSRKTVGKRLRKLLQRLRINTLEDAA